VRETLFVTSILHQNKNHPKGQIPADQSLAYVPGSTTYLDVCNQIRMETRTTPKRLDELLSLDPEPPRAPSDVLDLPLEELTGDPEL
jgi:hypothetical protein